MDQFPIEMTGTCDIRCGEIYMTAMGDMEFYCTLCDNSYKGFPEYNNHIATKHYPLEHNDGHTELYTKDDDELVVVLDNDDSSSSFIIDFESDFEDKEYSQDEIETASVKICHSDTLPEQNNITAKSLLPPKRRDSISDILKKLQSKSSEPRSIKRRRNKPTEIKYTCPYCDYTGHDRSNFINHVKRHFGNKPHKCEECGKTFYTRNELNRHGITHTGERLYLCHDCGRSFPSKHKLAMHLKRHLNIRDKRCATCGKSFFSSEQLFEHMTVHSDERHFKCEYCNAAFKRRRALATHKKLHANKREYQCRLCPANFNQNPGLRSHMKSKHPLAVT